jgi:lactaldehyde dehydrogenase/glycolaldehyde dehydrogenase
MLLDFSLADGVVLHAPMYIDGAWCEPALGRLIEVENPASEDVIATVSDGGVEDADRALRAARKVQPIWAALPAIKRAEAVAKLAELVQVHAEELARIVTLEQGKPIAQARGEISGCVAFLTYAAQNARRIEGDIVASDNLSEEIQIRRHPYGVVVGLTSWNYPAALVARKLGPALVAGNTFVLLSHENTPLSGLALARLAHEAGIPAGVFNVVTGRGAVVGQAMVESPLSNLITMTGSTRAGREIIRAGADELKINRLELGGKAPFIVMSDANIDAAVKAAVTARFTNCGQICTCNERMYLHKAIADEFLVKFVSATEALTIGDPMGAVDLGPKVSGFEAQKVAEIASRAKAAGAEALLEGGPMNDGAFAKGHWYAPTVLEVKDNTSPAMQEELFGPVAAALRVDDLDQAIAYANDTPFGLSAYLFTSNAKDIARTPYALNFGELYLNRSNGEAVQGFHNGWGHSGLGGEDGKYGFDGYLRKQTTYNSWA